MPRSRAFTQVDVFGTRPYSGNPLAVVLDGEGIDDDLLQDVARWTNLSETTFVLPPTTPEADYRVRIMTPGGELPFAGHPTLGTAHAWLVHGGTPRREDRIVQECGAGLVDVLREGSGLAFTAPPLLRTGPLDDADLDRLVAALGISRADVVGHQWVDNGPGWAAVRLPSAEHVRDLRPDWSHAPDAKVGVIGWHEDGGEHLYETRAFVPGLGVGEDPVTGSLNAGIAQWLVAEGEAPHRWTVTQGGCIGRSGVLSLTAEGGEVRVGGTVTSLVQGTISL